MSTPTVITQIANENFEALVSKGIHAMLFALKRIGGTVQADTSVNLLYGYPIGGFTKGEESAEQEEFQDQIRGGIYKTFVGGAIDPGDIIFNAYFSPTMGKPEIEGAINSTIITPQFVLLLARKQSDTLLQGFLAAGVNYSGGNDIKGDYGKIIGSSLKFKASGKPSFGYEEVGTLPMSLYNAGGGTPIANVDPVKLILDSAEIPMTA